MEDREGMSLEMEIPMVTGDETIEEKMIDKTATEEIETKIMKEAGIVKRIEEKETTRVIDAEIKTKKIYVTETEIAEMIEDMIIKKPTEVIERM